MKPNGLYIDKNTFVSFAESSRGSLAKMIATRQNSIEFYTSLMGYLPDPDPILRKAGKDVKVYHELLLDPHVYSCMQQRKFQVQSMEWELDKGKSKNRSAKIIEDLFNDPDFDLSGFISTSLDAIGFGFQPFEIMWENVGSYLLPVQVLDKPVEWFVFDNDNRPKFRSKSHPIVGEPLPDRKFLFAQHKPSYNNPYGERVLSRCFWPVTFKKATEKWWITFIEKYGMAFLLGKLPRNLMGPGSKEQDQLLDLLDQMIQDGTAVIPDDGSVEFKDQPQKTASSDLYRSRAEYSNNEISKAILTVTLTTEMSDRGGSYNAAEIHAEMIRQQALEDKKIAEREINQLIQWIYHYNFSDPNPPRIELFIPEDVDKELADRDQVLTQTGVKFTKKYFVNNYNLSEDEFEISSEPEKDVTPPAEPVIPKQEPEFAEKEPGAVKKLLSKILPSKKKSPLPGGEGKGEGVDLTDAVSADVLQQISEAALKPVFDLIESGEDLAEVKKHLEQVYPDMDTAKLEELLTKMYFIQNVWGRIEQE